MQYRDYDDKESKSMSIRNKVLIGISVATLLTFIIIAFSTAFTVDQGDRAVVLRNGKILKVAEPGLHFKTPIIDSVRDVSVREHTVSLELEAYSKDQQPASIKASITFSINETEVDRLYSSFGTITAFTQRVLTPRGIDAIKNTFGQFTATESIQKRGKLGLDTKDAVGVSISSSPVTLISVQYEEVGFSMAYEKSIEDEMLAGVAVRTRTQIENANKIDNRITVAKAQADADSRLAHARTNADAIRMNGEAEADAIRVKAEALASNPSLINLITAERWDGKLPATMPPNGTVPFLNLGEGK